MSASKEGLIALVNMLDEKGAAIAYNYFQKNFVLQQKTRTWEDIESVPAGDEEVELLSKIENKKDGYGEYVSEKELLSELNI